MLEMIFCIFCALILFFYGLPLICIICMGILAIASKPNHTTTCEEADLSYEKIRSSYEKARSRWTPEQKLEHDIKSAKLTIYYDLKDPNGWRNDNMRKIIAAAYQLLKDNNIEYDPKWEPERYNH
jgi:hypothetical protein